MGAKIDYYKTIKLILFAVFVYVLYCFSQNGRYQFSSNTQNVVIDTQSGKWYKINSQYNKVRVVDLDNESKVMEYELNNENIELSE